MSSEIFNDEVEGGPQLQELLVVVANDAVGVAKEPLLVHCPHHHLGNDGKVGTGWKKGENLDDAQVLKSLHARPPPPARSLKHLIRRSGVGVGVVGPAWGSWGGSCR